MRSRRYVVAGALADQAAEACIADPVLTKPNLRKTRPDTGLSSKWPAVTAAKSNRANA